MRRDFTCCSVVNDKSRTEKGVIFADKSEKRGQKFINTLIRVNQ